MSKPKPMALLAEQAFTHSKSSTEDHQINTRMMQNVLLVWLDPNIDQNNVVYCDTIAQLQCTINNIIIFTDPDQCVDFFTDIYDEHVCIIVSGVLSQRLVPLIHSITQIQTILIFSTNKAQLEYSHWQKVKGFFTDISQISEALKEEAQECEQNSISISLVNVNDNDVSKKKLDQLDSSFMYTQILKEILLTITFEKKHRSEFLDYCREQFVGNDRELKNIQKLEMKYHDETPIWWYTCESFLYPMVNRVLRMMDVDLIIKMGFFIGDVHRQIEQLHKNQFNSTNFSKKFAVYRGQGMNKMDFERMIKTKGGLLSFNCFLSTSRDHNISLGFANRATKNINMVGVLFEMTIDPSQPSTPFASIVNVSFYGKREDEILFSMHTIFRIGDIKSMSGSDRLFRVELTLTSDNDEDLRRLTDHIREETFTTDIGWYRLGWVLMKMGETEKAQQVCETLLKQETEEDAKAAIYNLLGIIKVELREYAEAIRLLENNLEIAENSLPPNHPNLTSSYSNIGNAYQNMGDYPKALSFHKKALAIRQQSLPRNHPDLASSFVNLSNAYAALGDYPKAFLFHEKALAIRQQSLPPNHPDLATSYTNISAMYCNIGDYLKALPFYEKALAIQQQSLPPNHPDLTSSYSNIGLIYYNTGDYPKALSSHEKAIAIQQQSLPPNHPDLASSYANMGNVHQNMSDYPKALSSYEKAIAIQQQSLPPNHPDLASSYANMGNVHQNMSDYPKALSSYEKALAIQQQSLPPNHPHLAKIHCKIGLINAVMENYSKACSSLESAVNIGQQSLQPNHPDLQLYQKTLAFLREFIITLFMLFQNEKQNE